VTQRRHACWWFRMISTLLWEYPPLCTSIGMHCNGPCSTNIPPPHKSKHMGATCHTAVMLPESCVMPSVDIARLFLYGRCVGARCHSPSWSKRCVAAALQVATTPLPADTSTHLSGNQEEWMRLCVSMYHRWFVPA
jgi:hypothetical protein